MLPKNNDRVDAQALEYLHSERKIHRDVKVRVMKRPKRNLVFSFCSLTLNFKRTLLIDACQAGNLLAAADGAVKLADFGVTGEVGRLIVLNLSSH